MKKVTLLLVFILYFTPQVFASIIFDSGDIESYANNENTVYGSAWASGDGGNEVASLFWLEPNLNTITDVHWWGVYSVNDGVTDDFYISIYNTYDNGFGPGTLVNEYNVGSVKRENTGWFSYQFDSPVYYYSVFIDPIKLNPNQPYWLSISNITDYPIFNWRWQIARTSEVLGLGVALTSDSGALEDIWAWPVSDEDLAFYLTNDASPVPEPSTFFLLGGGLVGLGFVVRRRRKE